MNQTTTGTNIRQELEISEQKRLRLRQQQIMGNLEPEDVSLWVMVDLMSLILIFFILLYANQVSKNTAPVSAPSVKTMLEKVAHRPQPKQMPTVADKTPQKWLRMKNQLTKAMAKVNIRDYSIELRKDRIVLTLGETISFAPGQDILMESIKEPLTRIAKLITSQYTYQIIVSGHTDNTPIHTEKFPSNWELSLGRAMQVAKFFMAKGVDPHGISVEGFGPYRPVADNLDPLGRKANRRVEISLITQEL